MIYKLIIIVFVIFSPILALNAQESCKEVQIFHSYEHLYISYISPVSCCDSLMHGPIIVKDSLNIKELVSRLENNICDLEAQIPDVRFKVIFLYPDKQEILCFSQEDAGMLYKNELLKYNNELCIRILNIIEKSGAIKPKSILPPE